MSILDNLIGVLAPHTCLGCGAEGRLLCPACASQLTPVEPLCYRCQRLSSQGFTCLNCASPLARVRVVTNYSGPAKALIWQLKLNGAQAAARIIARHMALSLNDISPDTTIVPVPTATSRARQRGYDQAKLLARELSRQSGLRYLDCLVRHGRTSQHGANRSERLQQLQGSFRIKRYVRNKQILLVDDVITTGATLEVAAKVLQGTEVSIQAIAFARPAQN